MNSGQRKRLADITEKLGIALFAGVVIQSILAKELSVRLVIAGLLVGVIGLVLLGIAVSLSKDN